jgi:predicted nucleic acid-binding protein
VTRALLDTNVVLDYALGREPFAIAAREVMEAYRAGRFHALVSPITPVNVFYVAKKQGQERARLILEQILTEFEVASVDLPIMRAAFLLPMPDYEDAVQAVCAIAQDADFIITRNVKDFKNSPVKAISPAEFLQELG